MNHSTIKIISKLPNVGTTIFTVMSKMAAEHGAVNLSQGFPDFECSPKLIELVNRYMQAGNNQYAPMPGYMGLRERIAEIVENLYNATYNPDTEITITAGATQAIYTAITATIGKDDEVIIFEPAYDCYAPAIELNGGVPKYIKLSAPDYKVDWSKVKAAITVNTKMIIINTPHNPTGTVLNVDDMQQLQEITDNTNIIILSDEVYEHIIFDSAMHQSVCRFPKLAQRSFVISSFGKTLHTTGWKIGYCLAPYTLMQEFRKVHQYLVFAVNTPIQHALADFLKHKDEYENLGTFYQKKRDYFIKMIAGLGFQLKPAAGTYFQVLNFEKLSKMPDKEFAIQLTQQAKVASVPISAFYHDATDEHMLRFCFAKKNETMEKAVELLQKSLLKYY